MAQPQHKEHSRIGGHTVLTVTVLLATQCGVSSQLWSAGIRAGRGGCSAAPRGQSSLHLNLQRMAWMDSRGWTSSPPREDLSSPQCPPHSCPSHSSLLLAVK